MNVSDFNNFAYLPPPAARGARRILIKPNLGYPFPSPVTVSLPVLERVIEGLRAVNPTAEILIVEGVCHRLSAEVIATRLGLKREGITLLDADQLPLATYLNPSATPARFREFQAPALLRQVDCRISLGTCKWTLLNQRPLFSGCIKISTVSCPAPSTALAAPIVEASSTAPTSGKLSKTSPPPSLPCSTAVSSTPRKFWSAPIGVPIAAGNSF